MTAIRSAIRITSLLARGAALSRLRGRLWARRPERGSARLLGAFSWRGRNPGGWSQGDLVSLAGNTTLLEAADADSPDRDELAQRARRLHRQWGMSLAQIASHLGVSQERIANAVGNARTLRDIELLPPGNTSRVRRLREVDWMAEPDGR